MSVKSGKTGKSSHDQKPVTASLSFGGSTGTFTVGVGGGGGKARKTKLARPSFYHKAKRARSAVTRVQKHR